MIQIIAAKINWCTVIKKNFCKTLSNLMFHNNKLINLMDTDERNTVLLNLKLNCQIFKQTLLPLVITFMLSGFTQMNFLSQLLS